MKLSKEAKTGILGTVAIALFIFGFNFLKGTNIFSTQRHFFAVYNSIEGLVEANSVVVNGYKIGIVKTISLKPDNSGKIVVEFSVTDNSINIPQNSVAKIISSDLLGTKAIQIIFANDKGMIQDGDTLKSDIEEDLKSAVDKRIAPLQKKAESLISSVDSVMIVVQSVFNESARQNLKNSFESIQNSLQTFERTSKRLDTLVASEKNKLSVILSKVESISSNLAANNEKLTNIINNFSSISDSLAKANITSTVNNANTALSQASQIMEKINKGEGSMGMLVNNKSLYNKLDSASANLDRLFIDMKEHPRRYVHFSVFGKKDKK